MSRVLSARSRKSAAVSTPVGCHAPSRAQPSSAAFRIALVGSPNVGKSALFNRLTSSYVTVSNFPGTSVEVTRAAGRVGGITVEVVDTPGMYSLLATSEEERVAQRMVLTGEADVLLHVVDAKSVARMLPLTLQLAELGRPLVLALNMMDEAERLGIEIDDVLLGNRLGVPVVPIVAVTGRGLPRLEEALRNARGGQSPNPPPYANGIGEALATMSGRLRGEYPVDRRSIAALALQRDATVAEMIRSVEPDGGAEALLAVEEVLAALDGPAVYRLAFERQRTAEALLRGVTSGGRRSHAARDALGRMLARPLTGLPVLLLVLYVGLYKFVGQFGAGTLVDLIEGSLFERHINPFLERAFALVPSAAGRALFVGDYGILTLGLRYAVAIILPVVGTFFLFFSVLEDSGYFPRLALLVDRAFKRIGLSGRAVIPMVLGFACDTMATMVTRTLETKRERVLATMLLALAVPCSAQLGVILAVLAGQPAALGVWSIALLGSFLLVGALTARVMPGEAPHFHMELPPLRVPRLGNVLMKTYTRMHWYFAEVLPLFLFASVLLWIGDLTGMLSAAVRGLTPVVRLLGLPAQTASVFLFGFFRRDYGAAGLFELQRHGLLSVAQLTVAAVTLTLFVPCIAQFLMMVRERGWKSAAGMVVFITPFAFGVGFALNLLLRTLGW